jgi:hypothetical protein
MQTAITLRSAHGRYLCAEDGGGNQGAIIDGRPAGLMVANRPVANAWEKFGVERVDATHYALRSHDGHYVCAESGGGHILVANRNYVSQWEIFRIITHADGRVTLVAHNGAYVCAELDGSLVANRFDIGSWECFTPSEPFATPVFVHPDPIVGQLTTLGDRCYADNNGARIVSGYHGGDLFCLWASENPQAVAEVEGVLAKVAAAGHHLVRSWAMLNDAGDPANVWVGPFYTGVGPRITRRYTDKLVGFARLLGDYGLQWHMAPGGLDGMNTAVEESMFRCFADAMDEAGSEHWALVEACNEARDTTDRDGDNTPEHLTRLINIVRARHPQVLYALTSFTGTEDPDVLRPYNPSWTRMLYHHGYRGGSIDDKIRHPFSLALENGIRRLVWGGEECGPWSNQGVPGDPLTRVSAQDNGKRFPEPGDLAQFDDESVSACGLARAHARGTGIFMCSTGVRQHADPATFPGFASLPALIRMLPKDTHTGTLVHGGRSSAIVAATTNPQGHIGRADQTILPDGRLTCLLYGDHDGTKGDETYRYQFRRGFEGTIVTPGSNQMHPVTVSAGATLDVSMRWARLLVGMTGW